MAGRDNGMSQSTWLWRDLLCLLCIWNKCNRFCKKTMTGEDSRLNEWFVPRFGPLGFRVFIGLLFLPYTAMCVSFAVIGSLLAAEVSWNRVCAIAAIYGLGLGVAAHSLDTLGSKKNKPWGNYFSK